MAIIIITFAIAIITLNYIIMIVAFRIGLSRQSVSKNNATSFSEKELFVSVIIAARNEEETISDCIEHILRQDYPADLYEVIIINDQSTDKTSYLINEFSRNNHLILTILNTEGKGGKKAALALGIKAAKGDIIITTDADCIMHKGWIRAMVSNFIDENTKFVAGPVMLKSCPSLFNRLQCLEFNSLMASTAGAISIGFPIMSNGANMAFKHDAYNAGNDALQYKVQSGEDIFLMFTIKNNYGVSAIHFAYDTNAIVYTNAKSTLNEFIQQRLRWVSKSSVYKDMPVIYSALSIFIFNFAIFISIVLSILDLLNAIHIDNIAIATMSLLLLKTLTDYILIRKYSNKFGQKRLLWLIPIAEPVIIIYTSIIGIAGNLFKFKWKGRSFVR